MPVKIGVDITTKTRFEKSLENGGNAFINHLFTPQELRQNTKDQLASIFCLKEAVIKALELPHNSWLKINTNRQSNGKVVCSFIDKDTATKISSLDTSISHEGEIIISVAAIILEEKN